MGMVIGETSISFWADYERYWWKFGVGWWA